MIKHVSRWFARPRPRSLSRREDMVRGLMAGKRTLYVTEPPLLGPKGEAASRALEYFCINEAYIMVCRGRLCVCVYVTVVCFQPPTLPSSPPPRRGLVKHHRWLTEAASVPSAVLGKFPSRELVFVPRCHVRFFTVAFFFLLCC